MYSKFYFTFAMILLLPFFFFRTVLKRSGKKNIYIIFGVRTSMEVTIEVVDAYNAYYSQNMCLYLGIS